MQQVTGLDKEELDWISEHLRQMESKADDHARQMKIEIADLRKFLGLWTDKPKAKRKPYVPNPEALCAVCADMNIKCTRRTHESEPRPHAFVLLRGKKVTA